MLSAPRASPPAAAAAAAAPARFKFPNVCVNPVSLLLLHRNVGSSCKRVVVSTKAAYSRMPMDTPGAYQLIDKESGDKFIIWGGTEDDDSSIPSKEVLSWKPLASTPPDNNHPPPTQSSSNEGEVVKLGSQAIAKRNIFRYLGSVIQRDGEIDGMSLTV